MEFPIVLTMQVRSLKQKGSITHTILANYEQLVYELSTFKLTATQITKLLYGNKIMMLGKDLVILLYANN